MRIRGFSCIAAATVGAVLVACSTDRANEDAAIDTAADAAADSVALASAAAEALATTLRGSNLAGDSASAHGMMLRLGSSPWDTLLGRELERAGVVDMGRQDTSTRTVELVTHGIETRGDTVAVAAVIRRCAPDGPTFTYSEDSLVHRLTRHTTSGVVRWAVAGAVDHTHAAGTCESASGATRRPTTPD